MKIKELVKKICLIFTVLICSFFIINSAYAYSTEAVRLYNSGIENVKNEQYTQAADNFEKAIFQDGDLKDAYFNLGSVYRELGEMDKAKEILCKLVRKDPFDDEAAFLLAKVYFDTKEYPKALVYLDTITETSARYDKAQEIAAIAEKKIKEEKIAEKKVSRNWQKKVLKNFDGPAGVARDNKGNIYVANFKANSIQKISFKTGERKDITDKNIQGPVGLAVDSQNNLYAANYISGNIVKISPVGKIKVLLNNIKQPYFLFIKDDILYITEQNKNTLIMLNLWKLQ